MAKVCAINTVQPGEDAASLISTLRTKTDPYSVGVGAMDEAGTFYWAIDVADHVDDLPAFLRDQLDSAAAELGLNWTEHLRVAQPD